MNKVDPKQPPFFKVHERGSRENTIQSHYADLHELIGDFMINTGSVRCLEIIKELYLSYSVNLFERQSDKDTDDQKVTITPRFTDEILIMMELMVFMSKVNHKWSAIEQLAERNGFKRP